MAESSPGNRLSAQTSPYLLQHADNPVHWQPWDEAALGRARRENRLILLSIGYSACHWCHVMAHESFEDPQVAAVMNELFVCIKVDREERPDLDRIYQIAHQMLTQRPGGWPLTMFLTPDQVPFFGGTYFPKEARYGLPGFVELMQRVAAYHAEHGDQVAQQNRQLLDALARNEAVEDAARPQRRPIDDATAALRQNFDAAQGGFGGAPKFPHPPGLAHCLRRHAEGDEGALRMVAFTLEKMVRGGIYDQLAGGFCRYSVDDRWDIPHFEKMLYDNAQLLPLCAETAQRTGSAMLRRAALETGRFVMRDLQAPAGGYYSTLDADSEGEEGRFYVWTREQLAAVLDGELLEVARLRFGLDREPNFEGAWHLRVTRELDDIAGALGSTESRVARLLDEAVTKLLAAREQRVWPGRDEKILTSWNGLMIAGMARAGRLLQEPAFVDSAQRALDFVRATLWRDGRLLATCKDDRAHLNAYLDDHVELIGGVLELLQARWRDGDLKFAIELAERVLAHFEDRESGGFFLTADDHEQLIVRTRPMTDDATPAGNGSAAAVLGRLGHLLGETRYLEAAERCLRAAGGYLERMPSACCTLLAALDEHLEPPPTLVLRAEGEPLAAFADVLARHPDPRRLVLAIPPAADGLPGVLGERRPAGAGVAYLCRGLVCSAPLQEPAALAEELARGAA